MARIQLLLGMPHSGKTTRCLAAYAQAVTNPQRFSATGNALWISPAREARQAVWERLVPLTGGVVLQPNVQTFDQFAEQVLQETQSPGRAISPISRRLILRSIIHELTTAGQFAHFRQIAGTEGFLDVVSNFVSELKRAEIWPEEFRQASRARSKITAPRDHELCLIYERYQQHLLEKNWYDTEGRFWLARTAMQEAPAGSWRELALVVVDGFSDFTRTQQEMLEQLALSAQTLLLTLPVEHPVIRAELFAKPCSVFRNLQTEFQKMGTVEVVHCERPTPHCPAGLAHIRQHLFANPREIPPQDSGAGVRIVAAVGTDSEQAAIALRIKNLLSQSVSPRDIVVGLRSVSASGVEWAQYLTSAGIPVWCEAPLPWSRSPYLKALFGVLQLILEDWPFDRLHGVLNSSLFRLDIPDWDAAHSPHRILHLLRREKLHSQRELILRGLQRWKQRVSEHDLDQDFANLQFAVTVLSHLSEACQPCLQRGDLGRWADRLAQLTAQLGLVQPNSTTTAIVDQRDAEQFQRLLRAAFEVEQALSDPPRERSLEELIIILRDLVQAGSPDRAPETPGCVRILGAETLRHLQPKYVFLVELTEDAFPSRRMEDCLFSEAERVRMTDHGLTLNHREAHRREEMLLFYQAVTRATVQLTLSYSRVNARGHEVYASPYLTSLEQLFAPTARLVKHEGELDPIPNAEHVLTASDFRLAAVAEARNKRPGWWRLMLENESTNSLAWNLLASSQLAQQRFHTKGFTPYEGRISHPKHLEYLAKTFSAQRQFSATELERYALCPFRFWLEFVLNVSELPPAEELTSVTQRGSLVHQVLAQLADENLAEASLIAQRFRELVEERLQRQLTENELQQALLQIERQILNRWSTAYGNQHTEYVSHVAEQQLVVTRTLTEIPFGAARDADSTDPQHRFPPLKLTQHEQVLKLGGRIDRVDISEKPDQKLFTVIDYKTGARKPFKMDDVKSGRTLQLALYTLAVMQLEIAGPDAVAHQMGYWSVRHTGFKSCGGPKAGAPLDAAVRNSLEQLLTETVFRLVTGIRSGQFVVDSLDDECTGTCPYHTVCRVNQVRTVAHLLEKQR